MSSPNNRSSKIYPVILCGGSGTRLWPLSRTDRPKQFIDLVSERTMLQDTARMVSDRDAFHPPVVVSNASYRHLVAKQLHEAGIAPLTVILEPHSRNTAAAIALAALHLYARDPGAQMLVLPSDHVIDDVSAFRRSVRTASDAAMGGSLVTFGIRPCTAETGYGYIRLGEKLPGIDGAHRVARFVEKPDVETAEAFLESGGYLWNSGLFLFGADCFLAELARYKPALHDACWMAFRDATRAQSTLTPHADRFAEIESISVDYAVMEPTERAVVVSAGFAWDDVGSWASIAKLVRPDSANNVIAADAVLEDCRNLYLRGDRRLIGAVGLEDIVIVDTDDALLVAAKDRLQDVKAIVERLRRAGREEAVRHTTVERPWGTYQSLHKGRQHQVKHIVVEPGQKLSLQYHHQRAEHWIVVAGIAEVTIGDDTRMLKPNGSVHIPLGVTHRLYNPGSEPMHLIEVQCGDYLGEDDIVRLEDVYGRVDEASGRVLVAAE